MQCNFFNLFGYHFNKALIHNFFIAVIQIAPTLRRQSHSGFFASLKESQRGHHKREKERQPPESIKADIYFNNQDEDCQAQNGNTKNNTLAAFPGTDIFNRADVFITNHR